MKRKFPILITVLILIALAFWGGTFLGRAHTLALESSYHAVIHVHLLDRLHAGDTNRVTTVLDGVLDHNTLAIGKSLDRLLLPRTREQIERVIPRIQEYRQARPRRPPESVVFDPDEHAPDMKDIIINRARYDQELSNTAERVLQYQTD